MGHYPQAVEGQGFFRAFRVWGLGIYDVVFRLWGSGSGVWPKGDL